MKPQDKVDIILSCRDLDQFFILNDDESTTIFFSEEAK